MEVSKIEQKEKDKLIESFGSWQFRRYSEYREITDEQLCNMTMPHAELIDIVRDGFAKNLGEAIMKSSEIHALQNNPARNSTTYFTHVVVVPPKTLFDFVEHCIEKMSRTELKNILLRRDDYEKIITKEE